MNFESKATHFSEPFCGSGLCTEKDRDFLPPVVDLVLARRLDHQRLKRLDAFRAPGAAGSPPEEHDDAADEDSNGGGYYHGELAILDEHGAQFSGDGLVGGGVRRVGDDDGLSFDDGGHEIEWRRGRGRHGVYV